MIMMTMVMKVVSSSSPTPSSAVCVCRGAVKGVGGSLSRGAVPHGSPLSVLPLAAICLWSKKMPTLPEPPREYHPCGGDEEEPKSPSDGMATLMPSWTAEFIYQHDKLSRSPL